MAAIKMTAEKIKQNLNESFAIIRQYDWLINSHVLDFYVDNCWDNMPDSWKFVFDSINPAELAPLLLSSSCDSPNRMWPLSILAIRSILMKLTIQRNVALNVTEIQPKLSPIFTNSKIRNIIATKKIKLKKRHEIEKMSQITAKIASEHTVQYIVDFGSGLGHLARMLTYGYGLKVCCLEQQIILSQQASHLDVCLEEITATAIGNDILSNFQRPNHLNIRLTRDTNLENLVKDIMNCFRIPTDAMENFKFGIVGLHPCGDLASILMNFFLNCPQAVFVNLVGCCYMKLTTAASIENAPLAFQGYPLSDYLLHHSPFSCQLSYEAREIACHAIEQYEQRLRAGNFEYLKVHSYRAAIEKIICKHWPELRHSGLKSIKHITTFELYCKEAVGHLKITIPQEDIYSMDTQTNLASWKQVVILYTLRLMFAPLIESVILYDRILHLLENGCDTQIQAIFDPEISPRNHIMASIKL